MADTRDYSKDLSTSALAKALKKPLPEVFHQLVEMHLIVRDGEGWELTPAGKTKGGLYKDGGKNIGRYIVWPETFEKELSAPQAKPHQPLPNQNVSKEYPVQSSRVTPIVSEPKPPIKNNLSVNPNLITATAIGKSFGLSATRINSIISELGWISRDPVDGWLVTELGKNLGGSQCRDSKSRVPYVRWPENIIKNNLLLKNLSESRGDSITDSHDEAVPSNPASTEFREKYKAEYRTADGHYVRSKSEVIIDNYLYFSEIVHAYERKLPIEEDVYCDFYIHTEKVYIEYWGLDEEKYLGRKAAKLEIYKKHGLKLIQLVEKDVANLEDVFPGKLREFGIKVD